MRLAAAISLPALALAGLSACGSSNDGSSAFGSNGGSTGGSNASATGAGNGVIFTGGGNSAGASGGTNGAANGAASLGGNGGTGISQRFGDSNCVATVSQGEQIPLDIYIMFDVSCSMNCDPSAAGGLQCCQLGPNSRLNPVRDAVGQFLQDPASVGISAGIGYFGQLGLGMTSCNPADYATPAVPLGPLPGNAQPIIDSLAQQQGVGETPTGAAIRGACEASRMQKQQNPSHIAINLLVTDGYPEAPVSGFLGCNPTLADAEAAASECAGGQPQIPTYVLGVGANLNELQAIAQAGGSKQAYLVEGGDVAGQVLQALNSIRGEAQIPCQFQIPEPPPGETLNLDAVNVQYTDPSGQQGVVYFVEQQGGCDPAQGGGWYYSDDQSTILLCPSTCNTVESQVGGQVDVALGCDQVRPPE